jgi:hypothetical protein
METTFSYLRANAQELGSRILETYPPLQSTKDPVAPRIATLLRKALPAQALAITGTAKYLRNSSLLFRRWIRLRSRRFRAPCSEAVSNSKRAASASFDRISVWE